MIVACVILIIVFFAGYKLIDWLFIDDSIKSEKIIEPEIELTIKDGVVDTLYIYRK